MFLEAVPSYAKLNLSLLVYSPRRDGYHSICSVFQEIALYDLLEISEADSNQVSVDFPQLQGQPNILDRVFGLLSPQLKRSYHVHLKKQIPIGAGLGGGSSNAATLLKWLVHHERLGLTQAEMTKLSTQLGADVSFFLTGGTALVRGIGEKVLPISVPVSPYYVLINPRQHFDTAMIYRMYDQTGHAKKPGPTPHSIRQGVVGQNSFKSVVWQLLPELVTLEAEIKNRFNLSLHLSGSGSTVFVCAAGADDARSVQNWIAGELPHYWTQLSCPKIRYGVTIHVASS